MHVLSVCVCVCGGGHCLEKRKYFTYMLFFHQFSGGPQGSQNGVEFGVWRYPNLHEPVCNEPGSDPQMPGL